MARAGEDYIEESASEEVTPILLVRVLDIPLINDPSTKVSLYLTNSKTDVAFFDEDDVAETYTACALTYDQVRASTDNEINSVTLRLDNVSGSFTSLAKDYVIKGVRVQLLETFADTLTSPAGARTLFEGHIEKANITISSIEIQVTADFSLSVRIPRRLYWVSDFPHIPSAKDPRTISLK
jgi:hypothetical protein